MPRVIHDGDVVVLTTTVLNALDLVNGQDVDDTTLSLIAGYTALEICAVLDTVGHPIEELRTVVKGFIRNKLQ